MDKKKPKKKSGIFTRTDVGYGYVESGYDKEENDGTVRIDFCFHNRRRNG